MQNKTALARVSLPRRLAGFIKEKRQLFNMLGSGGAGFVMANCFLFGGISPFGVALTGALEGTGAIGAAIGATLGYVVAQGIGGIKYITALALILCSKWLFGARAGEKKELHSAVGTSLLCMAICGGAATLLKNPTIYDLVVMIAEIFLAAGAAYFFGRAVAVLGIGSLGGSRMDISCVAVAGCVVLMGLTGIAPAGLSVGRILGVLVILVCARGGKESGGSVAGVAAGVSIGLAGGNYGYLIGAYGFGGLAAGIFGGSGKIPAVVAFAIVNSATALLSMDFLSANRAICEVFIAGVIFVALPGRWTTKLQMRYTGVSGAGESTTQATLQERLEDISFTLREIGKTTHTVSKKLSKIEEESPESICQRVAERVCSGCAMKTSCWQMRRDATSSAMRECIDTLRADGSINKEKMPKHFIQNCCRLESLANEMSTQFDAYTSRAGVQRKVSKVRTVLTDQFDGMALMLEELSAELCRARPLERERSDAVYEYFAGQNLSIQRLSCSTDQYQRAAVELVVPGYQAGRVAKTRVTLDLCSLLEADFDLPEVAERERLTTFIFREKATYTVEMGAYQLSSGKSRICGDAYDFIRNKGGCAHFVISDGMGCGGSAAVDSSMACGLLVKLIGVGVSYEAALKMVNSALLVKSGEESLATIDCCALDLFTGKASFYKAGAAPSFIIKSGKAGHVESASLPAGILHGVAFEKSSVTLHEGDIILMVSDGVVHSGSDWVKSELGGISGIDMQRLSEKIAMTAKMRCVDGHEDDITVVAAALRKGS